MLIFYAVNIINQLFIYTKTFIFKEITLPIMISALGFIIALIKSRPEEDIDIESYVEPEIEVVEEVKVEKKAAKKTTKKKTSKNKK